ncbi:uncharacterized protein LOC114515945 [Dendronephthya gigantea]|uniref:uncharacterized protein LOC114515945 n=1 Tax=Dendronephthya gigantea TaxID=151771 RepID=UPI00106D0699|nr:uncharacterized protein LOC114515945 [Dendronephthya gigantea]
MKAILIILELFNLHMAIVYTANGLTKLTRRATEDGKLFVLAKRNGASCVSVDSVEPCPLTWKLSSYASKMYRHRAENVNNTLYMLTTILSASDDCRDAMKKTLCAVATPKCLADGSQEYEDTASVCPKIYSTCPATLGEIYKKQKFCDKVPSGRIAKPTCVAPPEMKGHCPQPKYKMPSDALIVYKMTTADDGWVESLPKDNVPSECISRMTRLQCMPVYCSEDEKYLLTEFTKDECNALVNTCFKQSPVELKMKAACNFYPGGPNVTKAAVPPTVRSAAINGLQRLDCVAMVFTVGLTIALKWLQ